MNQLQAWQETNATVFTADYIQPTGQGRPCWNVTYNYRVRGEYYSGKFTDFATDSEVEYHRDDVIQIEYSTTHPAKSRMPGAVTYWSKAKLPFAIGGTLGFVAIIIYILTHRSQP